ncbi:hypothetical protein BDZ89DRAFT_1059584 [Hymenopellis radicata]|nr:hypothetical protein BDZ89DRAFT_1059584 [Hymenopellis radicata]
MDTHVCHAISKMRDEQNDKAHCFVVEHKTRAFVAESGYWRASPASCSPRTPAR